MRDGKKIGQVIKVLKGAIYHVTMFEVTSSTVASANIKIANQRDLMTQEYKL